MLCFKKNSNFSGESPIVSLSTSINIGFQFETELIEHILNSKVNYKKQIYSFTFNFGCLPKHANKIVKKLIKENKISQLTLSSQRIHKLEDEKIEVLT